MKNETEKRYKYLVNARNYHYTQFNVWMGFFIVIVGASFFAYGKLMEMEINQNRDLFFEKIIVIALGYFISLLFHLSSKGYYYWITNFINLIMDHEKSNMNEDYSVYSVFANKKTNNNYFKLTSGANISTSKIVCLLSYLLTFPWGILLVRSFEFPYQHLPLCSFFLITTVITFVFWANSLFILIAKCIFSSYLDKHLDLEIQDKKEPRNGGKQPEQSSSPLTGDTP